MTTTPTFFAAEITHSAGTIYASDQGYRTAPTDPSGPLPYPPLLSDAFQINVQMNLDPGQSGAAAAWGTLNLANPNGQFDTIAGADNVDSRAVVIRCGQKIADPARGIFLDPVIAALTTAFVGIATPWFLSDTALQIPLRDATYWIERPLQRTVYGGTGGLDGTADLAGVPKPKTRGGQTLAPVSNITPTLVDPANRIYQYNDGPGTIAALYEGGAQTITFDSDTTAINSGTTPAGKYRTDNSRGLFQLGSPPVHTITADVTGEFPVAGAISEVTQIARFLLTEDLLLPAANINTASFTATSITGGVYFGSTETIDGITAISAVLAGIGAKLVPFRDGTLRLMLLRALAGGATPVATFDTTNVQSIAPQALPSSVSPPTWRIRVGYNHNYTVQTSDLNTATATAAQVQYIAAADRVAAFTDTGVQLAYQNPNDPAPVIGIVSQQSDAQAVANDLGALWGVRRRLYSVVLPLTIAVAREIGDVVNIVFPMDDLRAGKLGQVVGYQFNAGDSFVTLMVLV